MSKYYGSIGYLFKDVEIRPGVYENKIIEKPTMGTIITIIEQNTYADAANGSVRLNAVLSIIADQYTIDNLQRIKYATYHNCKWKITNIEPGYPRLQLTLGELYND